MAANRSDARPASPSLSQLPPVPSSPTYSYASTANRLSAYNLPPPPPPKPAHTVLTQADLEQSQQAYSDLLATAKSYRLALATLSTAASAFGSALESCARLKESRAEALAPPGPSGGTGGGTGGVGPVGSGSFVAGTGGPRGSCTADLILGASGVHHLIANHQQILSETVYRSFEVPLLHELDAWRRAVDDEEEAYRASAAVRSREIRRLEKEGLKLHRQRRRDVGVLREHLVVLTAKLDGLTALHADHARTLLRDSQDASYRILDASCSLVRAEVDIFESLARKGWSGGGLDDLLEKGRDLFAADDDGPPPGLLLGTGGGASGIGVSGKAGVTAAEGARLFSILPPKSILADTASDGTTPSGGDVGRSTAAGGHQGRADSLLMGSDAGGERYQSLMGAVNPEDRDEDRARSGAGTDVDNDSIFSDLHLSQAPHPHHPYQQHQPRGLRPFSPQPIRRHPTDVIIDPDTLLSDDDEFGINTRRRELSSTGVGARDVTAQAMGLDLEEGAEDEGEEGNAAASPWKNEGLTRESDDTVNIAGTRREVKEDDASRNQGEDDGKGEVVQRRSVSPDHDVLATDVGATPEEREHRWGGIEDTDDGKNEGDIVPK